MTHLVSIILVMDKNHRPSSLWFHDLNSKQNDDQLIYEENNPGYFLNISETLSKKYLSFKHQ